MNHITTHSTTNEAIFRLSRETWNLEEEDDTVDATRLVTALTVLRHHWRADNQVFSVNVMRAFGEVIAAYEQIFEE